MTNNNKTELENKIKSYRARELLNESFTREESQAYLDLTTIPSLS